MKKTFLLRSVFLAGFCLIGVILTDAVFKAVVLPRIVIERTEHDYQTYVAHGTRHLRFAFFGDSHAQFDVHPRYIPGSFNFGIGGENFVKTYYKIRKIIEQDHVVIDRAVIELDLHSLSTFAQPKNNILSDFWYFRRFMSFKEIHEITGDPYSLVFVKSRFPFIGRGADFFRLAKSKGELYLGWEKHRFNFVDNSAAEREKIARNRVCMMFAGVMMEPLSVDYLVKTIQLLKQHNVPVVLIKYPLSGIYDEALSAFGIKKEEFYRKVSAVIEKVCPSFDTLDYQGLFFNHAEYFGDADHLNFCGARVLSEQICKDLKKYPSETGRKAGQ
jgi:hypothetical protein